MSGSRPGCSTSWWLRALAGYDHMIQEISQLDAGWGPADARTILANHPTKVVLGGSSDPTALQTWTTPTTNPPTTKTTPTTNPPTPPPGAPSRRPRPPHRHPPPRRPHHPQPGPGPTKTPPPHNPNTTMTPAGAHERVRIQPSVDTLDQSRKRCPTGPALELPRGELHSIDHVMQPPGAVSLHRSSDFSPRSNGMSRITGDGDATDWHRRIRIHRYPLHRWMRIDRSPRYPRACWLPGVAFDCPTTR